MLWKLERIDGDPVLSYEVEFLIEEDALFLFCHHAFGQRSIPLAANENLVKQVMYSLEL